MLVDAFNQEKALVGAFSVITNLRMELFEALLTMVLMRVLWQHGLLDDRQVRDGGAARTLGPAHGLHGEAGQLLPHRARGG